MCLLKAFLEYKIIKQPESKYKSKYNQMCLHKQIINKLKETKFYRYIKINYYIIFFKS